MSNLKIFDDKQVRTIWSEAEGKWYFVVEDVVAILTDSKDPKQYIKRLRQRDEELAKGWVQFVPTLSSAEAVASVGLFQQAEPEMIKRTRRSLVRTESIFSLLISIALIILMSGCNNKPKPIIIDPYLLKYDWVSEKDKYDNTFVLRIEEDTLMFQTLTFASNGYDRIAPYKISYDTLFITSIINDNRDIKTTFKYKIIKIDSLKLTLTQVFPASKDTVFFNKQIQTKKNDLIIERIEFYSSSCFGTCPAQSLSIGSDSVMYHYGYYHTKYKGLSRYKLSPVEFSRIQNMLYNIDINNFKSHDVYPDAWRYSLFIKTPNDSIETSATFSDADDDLRDFIIYLAHKERFIDLTPIENQKVSFRYGRWGELN